MELVYKDDHCTIIKFNESVSVLRQQGWLGDECEARVFYPGESHNPDRREIRIFKENGESYVLKRGTDAMVDMKIEKIMKFANNA